MTCAARARGAAAAVAACALVACGGATTTRAPRPSAPTAATTEGFDREEQAFAEHEEDVVEALALGDPAFGARVGRMPSLAGPNAEVEANWLSPRERARGLEDAEEQLARWDVPTRLMDTRARAASDLLLERELVARTLREERWRFDHERELPRAASDLVRAMLEAYRGAPPDAPAAAHDRWIVRRLDEIRASLRTARLSGVEADELDDALDPLEKLGLPQATAAIAKLRVELEAAPRDPPRAFDAGAVERALVAHLGVAQPVDALRARLERAEGALRADAKRALARLGADDARAAEHDAEGRLFGAARCTPGGAPRSARLRDALPPPERAPGCALVSWMSAPAGDAGDARALVALHDHVAVALWALGARPDGTPLMASVAPDRRAPLERLASVRPVTALAAGLAAEMLARAGSSDAPRAASRWAALGDAPLDVVEREALAKTR